VSVKEKTIGCDMRDTGVRVEITSHSQSETINTRTYDVLNVITEYYNNIL
jgi:hypothetical protein